MASQAPQPSSQPPPTTFDPTIHMCYTPPKTKHALSSLSLSSLNSTSAVAITDPFPFFTPTGIRAMRSSIFQRSLIQKYKTHELSDPNIFTLRGYSTEAPFVHSAWTSPEVLAACSDAAGVELEIVMQYEIGHLNVQLPALKGGEGGKDILERLPPAEPPRFALPSPSTVSQEKESTKKKIMVEDKDAIVKWHKDCYPWVCVVMLSDTTGMQGGETAIRTGDDRILKISGAEMGYAVMLQGALVDHVALKAVGGGERITMVTSFRGRDVRKKDCSHLRNVLRNSDLGVLGKQWIDYRLHVLGERAGLLRGQLEGVSQEERERVLREWVKEQIVYLTVTVDEVSGEDTLERTNFQEGSIRRHMIGAVRTQIRDFWRKLSATGDS